MERNQLMEQGGAKDTHPFLDPFFFNFSNFGGKRNPVSTTRTRTKFPFFSTVNVPTTKQGFLWKDAQLAIYLISLKEKCDISVTAFNIDIDIIKIRACLLITRKK